MSAERRVKRLMDCWTGDSNGIARTILFASEQAGAEVTTAETVGPLKQIGPVRALREFYQ